MDRLKVVTLSIAFTKHVVSLLFLTAPLESIETAPLASLQKSSGNQDGTFDQRNGIQGESNCSISVFHR